MGTLHPSICQSCIMYCCVWLLVCLAVCVTAGNSDNREVVDKKENLSEYSADGEVLYKTLWKLKDCAGPTQDGDDVTMIMKYYGEKTDGTHEQLEHTMTTKIGKGEAIRSVGDGLYRICLGEQRRLALAIPPHGSINSARSFQDIWLAIITLLMWR